MNSKLPPPAETGFDTTASSLSGGIAVVKKHLATLPSSPGVYRMLDAEGKALYVGKAKNLKKRVTAYTRPERVGIRIQRMIARTTVMEFVTTRSEAEALLLEANLIKRLKPRYNILLKDDRSFPFILVTDDHGYPQVLKHRGAQKQSGDYFGPFASAWAVNQTVTILQRAFLLRTCSDSVFNGRTRPCLLYQIKRCSAPCVDHISAGEYGALVEQARNFLRGQSRRIQTQLVGQMEHAAEALDFERAAQLRDRIRAMAEVGLRQDIHVPGLVDADLIALHQSAGQSCVQVFFYRGGGNYGNRAYYPSHAKDEPLDQVLEAFVGQFYATRQPPKLVLLSHTPPAQAVLTQALSNHAGYRVRIETPQRGDKRQVMEQALNNAREALARRLSENASQRQLLERLAELLELDTAPHRIEVYDNSHIQGSNAVGAMIVAGPEGFDKKSYRKFNVRDQDLTPGDDFAMMRQVMVRRFRRAQREDPERRNDQTTWPDVVIIDGGRGHLSTVLEVFVELGIEDIPLMAVSKGRQRNAGREQLHLPGRHTPILLEARDPVLYFIQRLRDEAHRFAIGSHRTRRQQGMVRSPLDGISGIGARRKKALLNHFGSAAGVGRAGLEDLLLVEGISRAIAQRIYDHFHGDG